MKKILLIVSLFTITGVGFSKVILSQVENKTVIALSEEDDKDKKKSTKKSCCASKAGAEGKACAGMVKDEANAGNDKAADEHCASKKSAKSCCKSKASHSEHKEGKAESSTL